MSHSTAKRDMSYRKPVPVYVPSPPLSACVSLKDLDDDGVPPVCISSQFSISLRLMHFVASRQLEGDHRCQDERG